MALTTLRDTLGRIVFRGTQDGGGGSLPTGWTVNDPDPGTLNANDGVLAMNGGTITANTIDLAGGELDVGGGTIDMGGGSINNAFSVTLDGNGGVVDANGGDVLLGAGRLITGDGGQIVATEATGGAITVGALGDALGFFGASPGSAPQVPATPNAQDVVDALVALGLVTQAAP